MHTKYISVFILSLWLAIPANADSMSMKSYNIALTHSFASYQCGNLEKAIQYMEGAVEIANKIKPRVKANALQQLASMYHLAERYKEALIRGEQAVVLFKQSVGEHHRDHIEAMAALAFTHIELDDLTTAEKMLKDALSIIETETSREYDLARAAIQTYLADIYLITGRANQSPALYRQAIVLVRAWPMTVDL